jgi:hypothetical protein
MTQDEIIEMARQAGFENCHISPIPTGKNLIFLEEFTKLVAAKEREACAQVCENLPIPNQFSESEGSVWDVAALDCAESIRARKQA